MVVQPLTTTREGTRLPGVEDKAGEIEATGRPAGLAKSCKRWVQTLTRQDLQTLARFAGFRLARVALSTELAEDVVQDAVLAVLRGTKSRQRGRHPRPSDLKDSAAFHTYLKGVIRSLVDAQRRSPFAGSVSEPAECHMQEIMAAPRNPCGELMVSDLAQELFRRTHDRAPKRLRRLVRTWAERWQDCDTIPLLGQHRRRRTELRLLAAEVLRQLAEPCVVPSQRKK